MEFLFGLQKDSDGNTGIVVFVDRLRNMANLADVPNSINGEGKAHFLSIGNVSLVVFLWPSALAMTLVSRVSFDIPPYRCLELLWICPRPIIHRTMVKQGALISLSNVSYVAYV